MIEHQQGSLFDAPSSSILVHACNAKGVWGSGIALGFHDRFPRSYELYRDACVHGEPFIEFCPGQALLLPEEHGFQVGCLITSEGYGTTKDDPEIILDLTEIALQDFLPAWDRSGKPVYSNRFNSGLFGVPWEQTEEVLRRVIGDRRWVVRSL